MNKEINRAGTSAESLILLLVVSIIWGSSFILIKKGLVGYTPLQIAALRVLITALVMMPFGWNKLKGLTKQEWWGLVVVGWIGSGIPSYLFPLAETQISSSMAAILNTVVPLNTLIIGVLFFGTVFHWNKLFGVLLGLVGAIVMIYLTGSEEGFKVGAYGLFIVLGGFCYATSVNTVKKVCGNVNPIGITFGAFAMVVPVALLILIFSDFAPRLQAPDGALAFFYILLLSIFGTALANALFYRVAQKTTPVLASSVTYLIPLVALGWGLLDGENIGTEHLLGLGLILSGVFLVSRSN